MTAMKSTEDKPKPGSPEAVALGCQCPILDNGHGRGHMGHGELFGWWVIAGCPIHGEKPPPPLDPRSPEVIDAAQERIRRMSPGELEAFVTHRTPGIDETDRTGMLAGAEGKEEE